MTGQIRSVQWLGHSAFRLVIDDIVFLFDPWIEGNPASTQVVMDIKKVDYVLVSHDHRDHGLDDGVNISRKTGAYFVGVFELADLARKMGAENVLPGNIGGVIEQDGVKIYFTRAFHSSGVGAPSGFIVKVGETAVYHAGDTSLFTDMKLYGARWNIDLALLPIGSTYTMDSYDAARALGFLRAKTAIPMHYNTFPQIEKNPSIFEKYVQRMGLDSRVLILKSGEAVNF